MAETLVPPQQQQVDPTLMADPIQQQKMAENVLTQLGLHPNQQGARSLLDAHFTGPTAHPDVAAVVPPEMKTPASPATAPTPPLVGDVPPAPTVPTAPPKTPGAMPQLGEGGAPPKPATAPTTGPSIITPVSPTTTAPPIAMPGDPNLPRIGQNADQQTLAAQREKQRLIETGSGIHQIKNPWLRTAATIGDIAGGLIIPKEMQWIPGTAEHHEQLVRGQENLINQDLGERQKVQAIQGQEVNTQKAAETVNELTEWMRQNPGKPISEYWRQKAVTAKLTPAEEYMRWATAPTQENGGGMTPEAAYAELKKMDLAGKPITAPQMKQNFQDLVTKMTGGQPLDPALTNDMGKLVSAISTSKNLTDEERQQMLGYLVTNNTPASSAFAPRMRSAAMGRLRITSGIDTLTNKLVLVTPDMNAAEPGRYISAEAGQKAESREAQFRDIHFNMDNVNEALNNLKNGFDATSRAQIAFALRHPHPNDAMATFLGSSAGQGLSPDQQDYLTALAGLQENVLSLRNIQGLGQSAHDIRGAIAAMVPGGGTPNREYAIRQMEILKGLVDRAETGFPRSGVTPKGGNPPKPRTIEQIQQDERNQANPPQSKTFTKQQIQAEVDRVNRINKNTPGWVPKTYADGVADAKKAGHTVEGEK